ncbi:hypothetical protein GCM10011396_52940 [Undibacterium terreum]|uniref:Uncharacterized protein n=1 Tax=Undibacterium terreum TaxID=1224302 RepID=A0A916V222_9BURK|nr:hypothetical protein GCM10011396_52940 [Undibacterium terreum]
MVGAVDIGDAYGQRSGIVELVFGKNQIKASHIAIVLMMVTVNTGLILASFGTELDGDSAW